MQHIKIIVARYNENLAWMNEAPFNQFRYIVYNKGVNEEFEKKNVDKIISLPNVGRCDHTYLYHIVTNYNQLNNVTVFFPGCLNIEHKKRKAIQILNGILKHKTAVFCGIFANNIKNRFSNFTLNTWKSTDIRNLQLNPESKTYPAKIRPYGKWFYHMFGNINVQWVCYYGILSVHKFDILKYNIRRYIRLLDEVSVHSNPEVGHYIERSWAAIFHPFIFTKVVSEESPVQMNIKLIR
jgi:hypothetical protein